MSNRYLLFLLGLSTFGFFISFFLICRLITTRSSWKGRKENVKNHHIDLEKSDIDPCRHIESVPLTQTISYSTSPPIPLFPSLFLHRKRVPRRQYCNKSSMNIFFSSSSVISSSSLRHSHSIVRPSSKVILSFPGSKHSSNYTSRKSPRYSTKANVSSLYISTTTDKGDIDNRINIVTYQNHQARDFAAKNSLRVYYGGYKSGVQRAAYIRTFSGERLSGSVKAWT